MSSTTVIPIELEGLERLLTQEEVEHLIASDPIATAYLVMAMNQELMRLRAQSSESPSAPPSSVPVYKKAPRKSAKTGQNKRGAAPRPQRYSRADYRGPAQ